MSIQMDSEVKDEQKKSRVYEDFKTHSYALVTSSGYAHAPLQHLDWSVGAPKKFSATNTP